MGFCGKENASCSAVCLPSHKTNFTTGLCLKHVTSGDRKNSKKLTGSAASFQAHVPPRSWVSSANAMAHHDYTTLSFNVRLPFSSYKGMNSRGCGVVLVLVWKCLGLDIIPVLYVSHVVAESLVSGRKNLNVESDSKWVNFTRISP